MAQPSVVQYFNAKKRSVIDDYKVENAKKILVLENNESKQAALHNSLLDVSNKKVIFQKQDDNPTAKVTSVEKQDKAAKTHIKKKDRVSNDIQTYLNNMHNTERFITLPNLDKSTVDDIDVVKKIICKSLKRNELKASISRFQSCAQQLKAVERKTIEVSSPLQLRTFGSIEFEVAVSSPKPQSPEKLYLSPKKDNSTRRNLHCALGSVTNTLGSTDYLKDTTDSILNQTLQLPFKYKALSEIFRALDTVAQILYNRKEVITFKKLKPAVEEIIKKTLLLKHLAQIKSIYPNAYEYRQEKIKIFGTGSRVERWELVIYPKLDNVQGMTSKVLLNRRKMLHEKLINKLKDYHNEFLLTLNPPLDIPRAKITRWHPEFDVEKVPDIECENLPGIPLEEKYNSGKMVLERARNIFNSNTRMEKALLKLNELRDKTVASEHAESVKPNSILKGIPKTLLEKVRQKQAAKAIISMTRTVAKEKELHMYSRLPEIARLTRNLFVTEKKGVLELDVVVQKLSNSYRSFLTKQEIEDCLKAIANAVPNWLIFHQLRSSVFLKLSKNYDISLIISKLEKLSEDANMT